MTWGGGEEGWRVQTSASVISVPPAPGPLPVGFFFPDRRSQNFFRPLNPPNIYSILWDQNKSQFKDLKNPISTLAQRVGGFVHSFFPVQGAPGVPQEGGGQAAAFFWLQQVDIQVDPPWHP